ncbi:conserved Plasmodium protein, unknown function [Plasmodium chabaudi adami]|uniref:Attractin/MKLN-like beta-propeller domain-containing protein n=1 Tax=Plasmodium chabaudi adami TaxID=5826 RepID=A0A1C6YCS1_PLACE|nr:conserved Plasmodium protein, unknown function [Plasmodium chabaudi adami]
MTTNKFLTTKTENSYISKFTHNAIIFGENLLNTISNGFINNYEPLYNNQDNHIENISFCSEVLPFYCKSEIIHNENIFNSRFGHSCILHKNNVYIYGGNQYASNCNQNLIRFSIDTHIFKVLEEHNKPKLRYYATLDLIYSSEDKEECLFLFGGKAGKYITNTTFMYNINNKTWNKIDTKYSPPPVFGHVSFKYKNIIFIHGGNMGNLQINSDIWNYFDQEKRWVKIISKDEYYNQKVCKPSARFFHSCALCVSNQGNDINLYIFGGLNNKNKCVDDIFWSYSLNNGKWREIKNSFGKIPAQRFGHSSILLNSRWFLLFGGYNYSWHSRLDLLDICAYDINLNVWSTLNVYGLPLVSHHFYGHITQVDDSGYFFIFGGLRDNKPSCKVYKYTPLIITPDFKNLINKIDEINKKVNYLENNPICSISKTYVKEINEMQNYLKGISFTIARYIQLIDDLNDKIKISNKLSQNSYSYLSEKFENNIKYYDYLDRRIHELEKLSSYSLSDHDEDVVKELW